jgi:hypothetical protein
LEKVSRDGVAGDQTPITPARSRERRGWIASATAI